MIMLLIVLSMIVSFIIGRIIRNHRIRKAQLEMFKLRKYLAKNNIWIS